MLKLERENAHPHDLRIRIDPGPHQYYIDDKKGYTSSTQVTKKYFKEFNALAVAKRMVRSRTPKYSGMTVQEIIGMWDVSNKRSSDDGNKMHKEIEAFYNDSLPLDEWKEVKSVREQFKEFHESIQANDFAIFRTEWMIFDPATNVCGMIDAVFIDTSLGQSIQDWKDGKITLRVIIIDWKRSKEIKYKYRNEMGLGPCSSLPACNFTKYSLQQCIYKRILEARYNVKVDYMAIAVFHPSQRKYQQIEIKEDKYVRVLDKIMPQVIQSDEETLPPPDKKKKRKRDVAVDYKAKYLELVKLVESKDSYVTCAACKSTMLFLVMTCCMYCKGTPPSYCENCKGHLMSTDDDAVLTCDKHFDRVASY